MTNPHDDFDDHPGLPIGLQPPESATTPRSAPRMPPEDAKAFLRGDDSEVGIPEAAPQQHAPLSDADRRRIFEQEKAAALAEFKAIEASLANESTPFNWLAGWANPLLGALLLGLSGVLGVFLLAQGMSLLRTLEAQPIGIQYAGYVVLGLCALAVMVAVVRLLSLYARMRRNQQVQIRSLQALQERNHLRWIAESEKQRAVELLEQYLREFPLADRQEMRRLQNLGLTPELQTQLQSARDRLLDRSRRSTTEQWMNEFRSDFQGKLDLLAWERINFWAKRTGVVTAVSPNGMVDSAAMLASSFSMLGDLCHIYQLRTNRAGTMWLFSQVFFQAFLSGQVNDWEKLTEDQLNHLFSPHGPLYEATVARVLANVGSKAASGTLNYFLLRRLGRTTVALLQPVRA
ncbi:DUF697 domain-containing protein [Tuwongella immobilis]|uniref:Uncharacterized protein n=1 Tax=Tuwongella immobilis TaxID=692036 RepID=A0A6C2YSU9_9BACT|nr:DUF697 domain-containing protein [Tuwongella immobilis]VIP04790.1 Uncharacterized protein OS=Desulfonatronospira thiodismutans ASO3-1 GN=Dthio_PD0905 PE=4 SV=1: DUF697 [Tuwongella immobilis]VTS06939.1 Uncharacterized protein OS=Desulfonatronospira thiodismutans ASO3-1 GN=Dthio_PD0905 PE=4 SV=1: DUF697 [Tuwongella immobilis]